MFEFTFSKVKVDCLYLNKDALQPKKENCWKSIQSTCVLCFIHFDFKRWLKTAFRFLYSFLIFFLKFLSFTPTTFFWTIYASMNCSTSSISFASKQQVSDLLCCFPILGPWWGNWTQNGTHARLQWVSKKQLKVVNSTSLYSFQGGLISV